MPITTVEKLGASTSPKWDEQQQAIANGLAIYIGRGARFHRLKQSKWANPIKLQDRNDPAERPQMLKQYREYLLANKELMDQLSELKGMRLICHCSPEPCHGDILAEMVG